MPKGYNVPGGMYTYDFDSPRPSAVDDQEKVELLKKANMELSNMVSMLFQYIIWLGQGGHFTRSEL